MSKLVEDLEAKSFEEDDSVEVPPGDIVAYNELRSCADLFRMYTQGSLIVQPEFQREIVWKSPAQTRFIDSLIKQLPIPSMCFSLDFKTQKWQVIDGLQRIWSIIRFLSGDNWTLSKLDDVDPKISGQSVLAFANQNSPLNDYYRRVENLTLPITVLRCDYTKKSNTNYLFTIFHRLNTGAMRLNNQEIRNCIYSGKFNNLLKALDAEADWVKLNRIKSEDGHRFTKQEVILRFFAFRDKEDKYSGRLAKFLNEYMEENRDLSDAQVEERIRTFRRTLSIVFTKVFGGKAPKLSITLLESLLVGVSHNLDYLETLSATKVADLYKNLAAHQEFSELRLSEGLAKTERVRARLKASREVFAKP